jgi:hypothetical protein
LEACLIACTAASTLADLLLDSLLGCPYGGLDFHNLAPCDDVYPIPYLLQK